VGQHDRAADRTTKLILLQRSLGIENIVGIQCVIPEKIPQAAVVRVGARLGDQVYDSARDLSKLSLIIVRLHFEFHDVVNRRLNRIRVRDSTVVVDPVHQEHVAAIRLTIYGWIGESTDRAGCPACILQRIGWACPGRQQQQFGKVPAVQRQVQDFPGFDNRT
jgi:hypothetical protein